MRDRKGTFIKENDYVYVRRLVADRTRGRVIRLYRTKLGEAYLAYVSGSGVSGVFGPCELELELDTYLQKIRNPPCAEGV